MHEFDDLIAEQNFYNRTAYASADINTDFKPAPNWFLGIVGVVTLLCLGIVWIVS